MTLDIENARVLYKNFSGTKNDWNRNGTRSVDIIIDDDKMAEILENDGWNVKHTKIREEGDESSNYINLVINYGSEFSKPSIIMRMVDSNGRLVSRTNLDENTVSTLDKLRIIDVDVRINPHQWEMGGRSGIKGYVDTMIVNVLEDPFLTKYADEEFPHEEDF